MARLSLSLLGDFQVCVNGQTAVGFDTQKTRALLAYLADEPGKTHSRLALADLLWPERTEVQALNNLRNNLANLRRAIQDKNAQPAYLRIERDSIAFNPFSDSWIDSVDFNRLIEHFLTNSQHSAENLASLERAVDLYRGDFLDSFPPLRSSALEEWILTRRSKYRAQQIETLFLLTKVYLARKECGRAAGLARRQLAVEPWREEAYQQLMTALALNGERGEALVEFGNCQELLVKELGINPSSVTLQLVESIRAGSLIPQLDYEGFWPAANLLQPPAANLIPSKPSQNLPRGLTRLIGREEEKRQVKQLLMQHRLLMLTGAGGVGKSRLALAVASEVNDLFRDGVWFVELASVDQSSAVPRAVLQTLAYELVPAQGGQVQLSNYLINRQLLLVLDNCEHLIGSTADLAWTLLRTCPELKILATSRVKFGIEGEIDYRVPSLDFPTGNRLPPAQASLRYDAVHMLIDRAQAVMPGFEVNVENWPAVAFICQRLDGIPLALELAATHLGLLSPAQLAARLDGSFHFLTGGNRTGLPRHQTLRATIDWSYEMLTSAERLLLARLSIFSGGWTLEAAEETCAGDQIDRVDVLDLLMRLVNQSIVSVRRQPDGETRFYLLETVRQYALEKLSQSHEEDLLRRCHCAWVLHMALQAEPALHNAEHLACMKKLDKDRENIFHALRWAIDELNDIPSGLNILMRTERWWNIRGYGERVTKWLGQGISHWQASLQPPPFFYVEALGMFGVAQPDRQSAINLVERALALAQELPAEEDRSPLATAFYCTAQVYQIWDSDGQTALHYYKLEEEAFSAVQDHFPYPLWIRGVLLDDKSICYYLMENDVEAARLALECWETMQQTGDRWFTSPLKTLGMVAQRRGEYARAREYFEEALIQAAGVDDGWGVSGLKYLADLERQQGHYAEAVGQLQEAIRHSREQYGFYMAIELLEDLADTEIAASRGKAGPEAECHLARAACCLGAAESNRAMNGFKFTVFLEHHTTYGLTAELKERLDDNQLRIAWKTGSAMTIDQATQYALSWSEVN